MDVDNENFNSVAYVNMKLNKELQRRNNFVH